MDIKMILEINGKRQLILPDKPYSSAVCDDVNDANPLTPEEKMAVLVWLETWFLKDKPKYFSNGLSYTT